MAVSNQDALNLARPQILPDLWRQIGLGDLLAGMLPRTVARTGLTSSATQTELTAGAILSVDDGSAGPLAIVTSGSPGAGEVKVEYSSAGIATLTFSGAVTAYSVTKTVIPSAMLAFLAADTTALG